MFNPIEKNERGNNMILDQIKNIHNYEGIGFDATKILDFIERAKKEKLPEGKYELDGEQLFALIQVYETKDRKECLYEAHRLYMDIQYMAEGAEQMYCSNIDSLKLIEDRTPIADILFYDQTEEEASFVVKEGNFALFLPQDAHMPCCHFKEAGQVKKIVFKVQMA